MTLTEIKRVLREEHHNTVTKNNGEELTPIQKFQVYEQVLLNLLDGGHITKTQYKKWVHVY